MEEESSAKRRERLMALRSEAAASHSAAPRPRPSGTQLPDPLLPAASISAGEMSPRTPRFDYYTNPAAAFSGSKRKSYNTSFSSASAPTPTPPPPPFVTQGNHPVNASDPHTNQQHMSRFPGYSPYETPPNVTPSSQWRSPMQFQTPMPGYQGTPSSTPSSWNTPTTSHTQGYYPNSSRFGGYNNSNLGQGGSPMTNPGPRGSPHFYPGRGRGQQYSSSPGPQGSGGRGFQNRSGYQDRRSYYNKSMLEDPWQGMQAIVGNILKPSDGSKSWLPESPSVKKSKSDQGGSKLKAKLSLAEFLDQSFNETMGEG